MMFCPDMPFEDAYLKALNKVEQYMVTDQELQLKGKDQLLIVYVPVDTTQRIGVAEDDHGCNAAAGYTWSEVKQNCIRLFEDGVQLVSETDKSSSSAAYVVFAADSLKAEVYVPGHDNHPVLDRRTLPAGGYVWNQEDDDTYKIILEAEPDFVFDKNVSDYFSYKDGKLEFHERPEGLMWKSVYC